MPTVIPAEQYHRLTKKPLMKRHDTSDKQAAQNDSADEEEGEKLTNANLYIKLVNSQYDMTKLPDMGTGDAADVVKKHVEFLTQRHQKLRSIVETISEVAKETNFHKAIRTLFESIRDVLNAREATLYFAANRDQTATLNVMESTWLTQGIEVDISRLFCSKKLQDKQYLNMFTVKETEEFLTSADEMYAIVDMDCILSCTITLEKTQEVLGVMEFINKRNGPPYYDAEDEALVKMLARFWPFVLNNPSLRYGTGRNKEVSLFFTDLAAVISHHTTDLPKLTLALERALKPLFGVSIVELYLYNKSKQELWSPRYLSHRTHGISCAHKPYPPVGK
jgi:adenylate cyclase